jgi:hypothetical protein
MAQGSSFLGPGEGKAVNRPRQWACREGSAMPWFSDTKWKFGRVRTGADHNPADAMSSPAKSCT